MWEKFKSFIKGLFGIKREDLTAITGDLKVSSKMWSAIDGWLHAFFNDPTWNKPGKTHLTKFAGIVSGYAATLATNEIQLTAGKGARAKFIEDQIARFAMGEIRNNVQKAAAGGYVVLKPYVYGANIYTDVSMSDNFFPTRVQGNVVEAGFFVDSASVNGKDYVRLEFHDLQPDGVHIRNEAYEANSIGKGRTVPLDMVPDWADLEPDITIANVNRPLFAIIRMPFANQIDPTSKLPVSLYSQAMDSLKEIDRIYTEFLWEIHSGKRKQILDITAVQTAPGRKERQEGEKPRRAELPEYYTNDQYLVLDMGGNATKPYDDYTPDMRIEAYQRALNIQLRLLESQCQLSAETFTFDIKSGKVQTATEIISNDSDTYNTIKAIQENGMKQGLLDLVAIYDIYAALYGLAPAGEIEPSVEFGDSIFEDTGTEFIRRKSMADNKYLRPELFVSWYFGVSEAVAKTMMPEPIDPTELPFNNPPPPQAGKNKKEKEEGEDGED